MNIRGYAAWRRRAACAVGVATTLVGLGPAALPAAAVEDCAGRTPTIVGTAEADRLEGTSGRDVIAGRGGNDVIYGLGGGDQICGGAGRDMLHGGGGGTRGFEMRRHPHRQ